MRTIYIAHAMSSDLENPVKITSLVSWLISKKVKVLRPKYHLFPDLLVASTIKSIEEADMIIADVSAYSHGVGFEIGYGYALNKEIILIAKIDCHDKVSKFLRGLFPEMIFYQDEKDLINQVTIKVFHNRVKLVTR